MSRPTSLIKRKAAKAVVKHTAHGTIDKVRRRPARAASLLTAGATLGAALGYLLGRRRATALPAGASSTATPTPAPAATGTSTPNIGDLKADEPVVPIRVPSTPS